MFKKIFLCNCVGTGMVCYMILFVVSVPHCPVVGCKKKQKSGCDRSFYRFPAHPEERRRRWIAALHRQRKDGSFWSPGPGCRVCSDHFISGKKSDDPSTQIMSQHSASDKTILSCSAPLLTATVRTKVRRHPHNLGRS